MHEEIKHFEIIKNIKILNNVIYFTNSDKSFGITNTVSPYIELTFFS